jgi:hypothetical protein
MIGVDVKYSTGGLHLRAQVNYGTVSNTGAYNQFTGSDMGSALSGWYTEISYDVLQRSERFQSGLIPFVRYEQYNTHAAVEGGTPVNASFNRNDLTFGLGWKIDSGAMLKVDYQVFNQGESTESNQQVNAGVAVWF